MQFCPNNLPRYCFIYSPMSTLIKREEIIVRDGLTKSHSHKTNTGSSESTTTPKKSSEDLRAEEFRRKICLTYMGYNADNAGNAIAENDFENASTTAKSPIVKATKFHSAEFTHSGRDLPLPRNESSAIGSILPFILHVTLSTKLMSLFHIYLNMNGGWYFFIPVVVWIVVLVSPIAFLEISLGQFSSELSGSIFPKINILLTGISQTLAISRCVVLLAINTEHRYFSLILETLGELIFQPRKNLCYQQEKHHCYVLDECQRDGELFYQGGCYMLEELIKIKNITAEGVIRLGVSQLWKELYGHYPYTKATPSISRILSKDSYSHKLDAIFLLFLMCFVCSNMGVRKFKKCSKVFLIYFGLTLLAILVHLLLNDSGFKNLARFFQYTHSDASKLYTFTTWLNALTLVVIAHGVGDGTLHALGSMNPFKTDSQVISRWISIFSFATIVLGTFLFGYMEIAGSDRFLMEIGIMASQEVHRDIMSILKRKVSFLALFYNYSYTNLWAKFVLFTFYIAAIIGQIANHVLMAENFYTTVLNWFPQLTKINVKVLKHCLYAVYYVVIGWIYYFLQFDLVEYADEAYHLMRCVLLASVFWECVAVAKFYSMRRFLVNIRTMFAFAPKSYTRIRTVTPVFYYMWTFILPALSVSMFLGALFCTVRLTELDSAMVVTVVIACIPIFGALRLLILPKIQRELLQSFTPHSACRLAPFRSTDMMDTNFDERAARIII